MLTKNEFLEVSKILNDPKTTTQEPKYQGIQSVTEKTPIMAPPLTKSDISPNDIINIEEVASIKPPKTKDIFVNHWVRDLSSSQICQSNNKHDPLLLCVVVSAPSHFKERAGIREGWGNTAFRGKLNYTLEITYLNSKPKKTSKCSHFPFVWPFHIL